MKQKTRNKHEKKKNTRGPARGFTRGLAGAWMTIGTLAAYTALGAAKPAMAAAAKGVATGGGLQAATLPLKKFDIPAGPLEQAITAFEKTTGLKVKVVLPDGTLAGFNSPGVTGLHRDEEALRLLLEGTGLNYRAQDATTVAVVVQAQDTVSVSASSDNSIAMERFTEPLTETPQSVSVVPLPVMQDEGVSTLRDTLRNVPGIRRLLRISP